MTQGDWGERPTWSFSRVFCSWQPGGFRHCVPRGWGCGLCHAARNLFLRRCEVHTAFCMFALLASRYLNIHPVRVSRSPPPLLPCCKHPEHTCCDAVHGVRWHRLLTVAMETRSHVRHLAGHWLPDLESAEGSITEQELLWPMLSGRLFSWFQRSAPELDTVLKFGLALRHSQFFLGLAVFLRRNLQSLYDFYLSSSNETTASSLSQNKYLGRGHSSKFDRVLRARDPVQCLAHSRHYMHWIKYTNSDPVKTVRS